MDSNLRYVGEEVSARMDEILSFFKPGAKITVLVRRPDHADGSQDFMMTNDLIDDAVAALLRRKHDEAGGRDAG